MVHDMMVLMKKGLYKAGGEFVGQIFEKKYALNYFDFNKNYKLKPTTLMNFLQDISTLHLSKSTAHLTETELPGLWVIVEWQVDLMEMPKTVMDLTVKTEPNFFRKFIAYRRYEIEDDQGKPLGQAISKWAYLDPSTKKQINIPKVLNDVFEVVENCEKPPKIEFDNMEDIIAYDITRKSVYSDIDVNHHVNNVTYIKWAIDALGSKHLDHYEFKSMIVSFKREVFEGESIVVRTKVKETALSAVSKHQILSADGTVCVIVQIEWHNLN